MLLAASESANRDPRDHVLVVRRWRHPLRPFPRRGDPNVDCCLATAARTAQITPHRPLISLVQLDPNLGVEGVVPERVFWVSESPGQPAPNQALQSVARPRGLRGRGLGAEQRAMKKSGVRRGVRCIRTLIDPAAKMEISA